jgi:hypothetical protein
MLVDIGFGICNSGPSLVEAFSIAKIFEDGKAVVQVPTGTNGTLKLLKHIRSESHQFLQNWCTAAIQYTLSSFSPSPTH